MMKLLPVRSKVRTGSLIRGVSSSPSAIGTTFAYSMTIDNSQTQQLTVPVTSNHHGCNYKAESGVEGATEEANANTWIQM
jgi:hypothetical protein